MATSDQNSSRRVQPGGEGQNKMMTRSHTVALSQLLLVTLLFLAVHGLRAEDIPLDDLDWSDLAGSRACAAAAGTGRTIASNGAQALARGRSASSPTAQVDRAAAEELFEPSRPFVIGRDNLGFANPSGAVTCASMAGNCYTMAVVSKFFWESARFEPSADDEGFRVEDMASVLEAGPGTSATFPVGGYESLWAMTHVDGVNGYALASWMEERSRHELGLKPEAPSMADPENTDVLVKLYEVISTIHYLHYQQYQIAGVLEPVVSNLKEGKTSAARITLESLEAMKHAIRRDDLQLLTILNPEQVYGHTVLAYKVVQKADFADVYFYDNNEQHGSCLDETFFRIARDGSFEGWKKMHEGGEERLDRSWERASFWDPSVQSIIVFPDLNHDPARRRELASKLVVSNEEAAYLLASGDYLRALTEESPSESNLFENTRALVQAIQNVQDATGTRPSWRKEDLPADADVATLNRYLEQYTSRAIEQICPYALPEGLRLGGTRLSFDEADPNRAHLESTITITKDDSIDGVLASLRKSALSARDQTLARLIEGLSQSFEGETISSRVSVDLEKGAFPFKKLGKYGPVPTLRGSHTVVGRIRPSTRVADEADHCIEIGEDIARKLLASALDGAGILNEKQDFDYSFDLPIWGKVTRKGQFTLNSVNIDFRPSGMLLSGGFSCFAPVLTQSRGVNVSSSSTGISCSFRRTGKNVFRLSGAAAGGLSISAGMGMLDSLVFDAVGSLFGKVFPFFANRVEDYVEAELSSYVALPRGNAIDFRGVSVSSRAVYAGLKPFEVDFEATVTRLFGQRAPVELRDIRFGHDRMILLTSNDG